MKKMLGNTGTYRMANLCSFIYRQHYNILYCYDPRKASHEDWYFSACFYHKQLLFFIIFFFFYFDIQTDKIHLQRIGRRVVYVYGHTNRYTYLHIITSSSYIVYSWCFEIFEFRICCAATWKSSETNNNIISVLSYLFLGWWIGIYTYRDHNVYFYIKCIFYSCLRRRTISSHTYTIRGNLFFWIFRAANFSVKVIIRSSLRMKF